MTIKRMSNGLRAFERSLQNPAARVIDDRIAFILVRDGISREALRAAVYVDFDRPYYDQTETNIVTMLSKTADFLGVSVDWLLTGKGRNTREPIEQNNITKSAIIKDNQAHHITVFNYSN